MPDFDETSKLITHAHLVLMYPIIPTAVAQSFVDSSPRSKENSRERYPPSSRKEVHTRRRGSPQKDRSLSPRPAIVYAPSVPSGHTPSESSSSPENHRVRFDQGELHNTFTLFSFCPKHLWVNMILTTPTKDSLNAASSADTGQIVETLT